MLIIKISPPNVPKLGFSSVLNTVKILSKIEVCHVTIHTRRIMCLFHLSLFCDCACIFKKKTYIRTF